LPDKRQVAASFSRAAASYDSVAELQRDVGSQLLRGCRMISCRGAGWIWAAAPGISAARWASGFASHGVALDIAEGMLACPAAGRRHAFHRGRCRAPAAAGFDLRPDLLQPGGAVVRGLRVGARRGRRVLKPGGVFAFASLCVGTLFELRDSWRQVDGMVHVNRFREFAVYQRLCAASGLQAISLETRPHVLLPGCAQPDP
jgi:malonyl-CoA O-methyltransferase